MEHDWTAPALFFDYAQSNYEGAFAHLAALFPSASQEDIEIALSHSAGKGAVKNFKLLLAELDRRRNNATDYQKVYGNALYSACKYSGNTKIIAQLIKRGADINSAFFEPVKMAVKYNNLAALQLLLVAGADPFQQWMFDIVLKKPQKKIIENYSDFDPLQVKKEKKMTLKNICIRWIILNQDLLPALKKTPKEAFLYS